MPFRPIPHVSCFARLRLGAGAFAVLFLAGCAALSDAPPSSDTAYVVIGDNGAAVARVLTAAACPAISIDGRSAAMTLRAAAATVAQRPTASPAARSKPSVFALNTCEAVLPANARQASVGGHALPLPRAAARRIVVIGDTGCRLKDNGDYQDCNRPAAFPFSTVASLAARWQPDLVIHVGDFHYRENACPSDRPGCAGSPWGYGSDAWDADFFKPATPLLRAAPWVMVRGNHESCARAGQGWWRFLDPHPLQAGRDCDRAADDSKGDYSDPYAVPLGDGTQLIVLDTAMTSYKGLSASDPRQARYAASYRKMASLSRQATRSIVVDHHPVLAFGALRDKAGMVTLFDGDKGLQDAFTSVEGKLFPDSVQMVLSGHVHLWEQISFSSAHPTQFVSGFSGTAEDIVPLPEEAPEGAAPAPGAVVSALSSWVDGFGYMTMERTGPDGWDVKVWDLDGAVRNRCTVTGSKSSCEKRQVH